MHIPIPQQAIFHQKEKKNNMKTNNKTKQNLIDVEGCSNALFYLSTAGHTLCLYNCLMSSPWDQKLTSYPLLLAVAATCRWPCWGLYLCIQSKMRRRKIIPFFKKCWTGRAISLLASFGAATTLCQARSDVSKWIGCVLAPFFILSCVANISCSTKPCLPGSHS